MLRSVCLSVCLPLFHAPSSKTVHIREGCGNYGTLIGNPMLEMELTGQRRRTVTASGRNGTKTVAGAASEAFVRWLHRQQGPDGIPVSN